MTSPCRAALGPAHGMAETISVVTAKRMNFAISPQRLVVVGLTGVVLGAALDTTCSRAATTPGSNCAPAQRRISSRASATLCAARYGRAFSKAWKAEATATTRAASGISRPLGAAG
jgi:hypothetical protein